jgi:hypothetical protein
MPNKFSKKKNKVKKVKIMYGGLTCDTKNKAYRMLAHSGTTNKILDVPNNCVYITRTICGTTMFLEVADDVQQFFFNNKELVKNPCDINNFSELNRVFSENSKVHKYIGNTNTNKRTGTGFFSNLGENANFLNMHISRESCDTSAKCAKKYLFQYKDSNYQPCTFWFYKDNKQVHDPLSSMEEIYDRIDIRYSGLMSMDNSFEIDKIHRSSNSELSFWKYPMLTTNDIVSIYSYSLYPTSDDILQKIKELNIDIRQYLKITDPSNPKYFDPLNLPSDIDDDDDDEWHEDSSDYKYIISGHEFVYLILDNYTIKQSELFVMFPGVYYNMACRGFYEPKGLYESFTFSKKFQRQSSVNNRQNLLDLYTEEDENGSKEIVNKIKQGEIAQREKDRKREIAQREQEREDDREEEEQKIAQREEAKEREEREIAQREEQELLQAKEISSVGEPPIFNYPQLGKWFGNKGGKNKKTRRTKRSKKYYKNKTRQNNKYKNKTKKKKFIH